MGVRHVFYRLFSISVGDREDAATNVCRRPAWRLRPAARFLDPAHRHNVLRAISPDAAKTCSGDAGEAYRSYSLTRYPVTLEIARFSMSASGTGRHGDSLRLCRLYPRKQTYTAHLYMSALCHVWTAPSWQGLSSRLQAGRCSHVFGLFVRFT